MFLDQEIVERMVRLFGTALDLTREYQQQGRPRATRLRRASVCQTRLAALENEVSACVLKWMELRGEQPEATALAVELETQPVAEA